jgi:hypothetical protein
MHHFRDVWDNYSVSKHKILRNELIFIFTCFYNEKYVMKLLERLKMRFSDVFEDVYNNLLYEKDFWEWREEQKKSYKYDDKWFLEKFRHINDKLLNL